MAGTAITVWQFRHLMLTDTTTNIFTRTWHSSVHQLYRTNGHANGCTFKLNTDRSPVASVSPSATQTTTMDLLPCPKKKSSPTASDKQAQPNLAHIDPIRTNPETVESIFVQWLGYL
jgi:hypothetical protein